MEDRLKQKSDPKYDEDVVNKRYFERKLKDATDVPERTNLTYDGDIISSWNKDIFTHETEVEVKKGLKLSNAAGDRDVLTIGNQEHFISDQDKELTMYANRADDGGFKVRTHWNKGDYRTDFKISSGGATHVLGVLDVPNDIILGRHADLVRTTNKTMESINAINNSDDRWNNEYNSALKLRNNNNAMSFIVGGTSNNRRGLIQIGHENSYFAQHLGQLHLNKLGGTVHSQAIYDTTTSSSANVHIGSETSGTLYRSTSAKKYKKNIEDIELERAETFFEKAQPKWYRSKCKKDNKKWSYYGYVSDEVAEFEPRLVQFNEETKEVEGFAYDRVPALLHVIMKKDRKRIEELESTVSKLEKRLEALENKK